ncbi:abortive infection system antitoxin AbiGi family protein [Kurthia gibsonii]|uniref:abortive infection system antitoxin AbiGi family protein n=1 Tax=Kurthia gibsonii TaxID=33946 RepID=UPI0031B71412
MTEKIKHIDLAQSGVSVSSKEHTPPKQSANVLFKFMKEIRFLKEALSKKAIIPRYCEENIEYLQLNGIKKIAFPMACFCDIHLKRLVHHREKYGNFGIGLNREWGIEKGLQPIHYVNPDSNIRKDFTNAFNAAEEKVNEENESLYTDYLLQNLLYMKPIEGPMPIWNKLTNKMDDDNRNFQDEKEWRFVPDRIIEKTDLDLLIDQELLNQNTYNNSSLGIYQLPELWLPFQYDDIKYIVVETVENRDELIDFILSKDFSDEKSRSILCSKIMVYNTLQEDW